MLTFHDLYVAHAEEIHRFAYWLSGDAAEADDITSETFVRAWTHRATIHTETLKAYLLQIARNVYLQGQRRQRRQTALDEARSDPHPSPEGIVEERERLELAQRTLESMDEVDRAAFVLRVQFDLPYAEIARTLQISEAAAKVKVHRARKKMLAAQVERM